jgi:hypothetical protein
METDMIPVEKLDAIKEKLIELNKKNAEANRLYKMGADETRRLYMKVEQIIKLVERAKTHLSARRALLKRLKELS